MCTNPKKGFYIGKKENGKDDIYITNYACNHIELNQKRNWVPIYESGISPNCIESRSSYVDIPCGNCIECRMNYRKEWAFRIIAELKDYDKSCFITLTYDDYNLPRASKNIDLKTGEIIDDSESSNLFTLNKKHLQQFIKSLRHKLVRKGEPKIRFFACGEYGTLSKRPHYHVIIFGYCPDDLVLYNKNEVGDIMYNSKELSDIWHKGHVVVGDVTTESAAYVAGYTTKKIENNYETFYEDYGITPSFITMSRNGDKRGIGYSYYLSHKDNRLFIDSNITIGDSNGAHTYPIPKYFKKLYEKDNPVDYEKLREKNKQISLDHKKIMMQGTDISYSQELKNKDKVLNQKQIYFKERKKV